MFTAEFVYFYICTVMQFSLCVYRHYVKALFRGWRVFVRVYFVRLPLLQQLNHCSIAVSDRLA